jgi:hypothetical protein
MVQRKVESGRYRRIYKAQLGRMALMERMGMKVNQFQLHPTLQVQQVRKVYKVYRERKAKRVTLVRLVRVDLQDQLAPQAHKVRQEVLVVDQQDLLVQPARQVQLDLLV